MSLSHIYTVVLALLLIAFPMLSVVSAKPVGYVVIVIGVIGGLLAMRHRKLVLDWRLFLIMLAILTLGGLSALWSVSPELVIKQFKILFYFVVFFASTFAGAHFLTYRHARVILKMLPYALVAGAGLVLFEYLTDMSLYKWIRDIPSHHKVSSATYNPALALHVVFLWSAGLWLHCQNKPLWMFGSLVGVVSVVQLYVFSSQAAFLGLLISGVVFLLARRYPQQVLKLCFIGLGFCLIWAPLLVYGLHLWRPDFLLHLKAASALPRLDMWMACVYEILQSPFYGHGLNATKVLSADLLSRLPNYRWNIISHPHNFALQIWIELGAIGVAVALLFFKMLYNRFKALRDDVLPYALSCFMAIISIITVGHGMWQSWWLGTILCSVLMMSISLKEKE